MSQFSEQLLIARLSQLERQNQELKKELEDVKKKLESAVNPKEKTFTELYR